MNCATNMRGSMICKGCGEDKKHHALGLCRRCYTKQCSAKYRTNHADEIKRYRVTNSDKLANMEARRRRAHGGKPASENKQCPAFLGVHVAERVLSKVFKDVKQMPPNHTGYDFICNKGKKIDVKSACTDTRYNQRDSWNFRIRKNKVADYFLCLAFDNREDLNPLHIWLILGHITNHLSRVSISKSRIDKWDEYKLDISKTIICCNNMREASQ